LFGRCSNPPSTLAARLGLQARRSVYSVVGGDQPQALVNEFAEAIFAGGVRSALLAGAEATAAMKLAMRSGAKLDWSESSEGELEERGPGAALLSSYELENGLGYPTQTYPVFEQALRARLGQTPEAYGKMISQLLASFSQVAAGNRYAQFPVIRSAEFLETASAENYPIAEPYLKWHVAQDAVNQGAALVLTCVGQAQEIGVDPAKWVYLHGYAQVSDKFVTERPDLSRSRAMELVLQRALRSAGKSVGELSHFDLYSCFPCAVLIAAEYLGLDWRRTVPTVTGGLPFFGGPGNNYSMHAIATMVERLRQDPGAFGLVLANGGFLTKQAAGVYSTAQRREWRPLSSADLQAAIDAEPAVPLLAKSVDARVESYTVTYHRGQPQRGYILGRAGEGRILARARTGHRTTLAALAKEDPIGRVIRVEHDTATNYICPSDQYWTNE
jgi:acetyl-CoA C-acetyltransferase